MFLKVKIGSRSTLYLIVFCLQRKIPALSESLSIFIERMKEEYANDPPLMDSLNDNKVRSRN